MRFIELSGIETGIHFTVAIDHIISVRPLQDGGTKVLLSNGTEMSVSDTYRDVKILICTDQQS